MQTTKAIHFVSCHAGSEVGDVIVDGVAAPAGKPVREPAPFIAQDQTLRNFLLNERQGYRVLPFDVMNLMYMLWLYTSDWSVGNRNAWTSHREMGQ